MSHIVFPMRNKPVLSRRRGPSKSALATIARAKPIPTPKTRAEHERLVRSAVETGDAPSGWLHIYEKKGGGVTVEHHSEKNTTGGKLIKTLAGALREAQEERDKRKKGRRK